jgi:hypothetical protein
VTLIERYSDKNQLSKNVAADKIEQHRKEKNVSVTISGQVENLRGIIRITSYIKRLPICNDLVKNQFSKLPNDLYRLPSKK